MMGNAMTVTGYHVDYGLTDEFRARAVKRATETSVKEAAEEFRVAPRTIYFWRKAFADALGQ